MGEKVTKLGSDTLPGSQEIPLIPSDMEESALCLQLSWHLAPPRVSHALQRLLLKWGVTATIEPSFSLGQFQGLTVDDLASLNRVGPETVKLTLEFFDEFRDSSVRLEASAEFDQESAPATPADSQTLIPQDIAESILRQPIPWSLAPKPVANALQRLLLWMGVVTETEPTFSLQQFRGLTVEDLSSQYGVGTGKVSQVESFLAQVPQLIGTKVTPTISELNFIALDGVPTWFLLTKETLRLYGLDDRYSTTLRRYHLEKPGELLAYLRLKVARRVSLDMQRLEFVATHMDRILQSKEPATWEVLLKARFGIEPGEWPAVLEARFGLLPEAVSQAFPKFDQVSAMLEQRFAGRKLEEIGQEFGVTRERARQILVKHANVLDPEVAAVILRTKRQRAEFRKRTGDKSMAGRRENVTRVILMNPGLSLPALVENFCDFSEEQIRRLVPANLRKFVAGYYSKGDQTARRWTHEEMLTAIRAAGTYHFPLAAPQYDQLVQIGEVVGPGSQTVAIRFGTWKSACKAAGVEPTSKGREHYDHKWSWDEMVSILAEYLLDPTTTGGFADYETWRLEQTNAVPSGALVRNEMDGWSTAMTYALVEVAERGPLDSKVYAPTTHSSEVST